MDPASPLKRRTLSRLRTSATNRDDLEVPVLVSDLTRPSKSDPCAHNRLQSRQPGNSCDNLETTSWESSSDTCCMPIPLLTSCERSQAALTVAPSAKSTVFFTCCPRFSTCNTRSMHFHRFHDRCIREPHRACMLMLLVGIAEALESSTSECCSG